MKHTLILLWKGEISPWNETSNTTEEQAPLLQALSTLSEKLSEQMDEKGKKDLGKFRICMPIFAPPSWKVLSSRAFYWAQELYWRFLVPHHNNATYY